MNKYTYPLLFAFIIFNGFKAKSQELNLELRDSLKLTPYDLMSNYYTNDFSPFQRKNIYIGLDFTVKDRQQTNVDQILQRVIDGQQLDFSIRVKGGYYIGDYAMVGLDFEYYQEKFEGKIFRDPDTLMSNSIKRGYEFTPNIRSSVPLTRNERLSFYTQVGITAGVANSLSREIKNNDEISKVYTTDYNFRVGISPGMTFFVMENFAFEVQLDVLGYEMKVRDKTVDGEDESRVVRQNVNFNIDLLSLNLGLSYYIGRGK
ncbi:outer membrane beta-barrel protein [Carboxylicivirga linearis]|uniref:Outer membrane beta-barrel protein n=1 Tax=Carboxylicivirga linearis TaxID=1628157 RepID=A0ABS5JYX9_9BACT|nr:outer membrane beta-barrel protein [Carboxylicivirga linearis]MBS2100122.1 outer membrane beta-barrel protein [Carboxylicivirga linearis]